MPELQHPDIVGNYLGSMYQAQDRGNAQKTQQFNQQRLQRQDERAEVTFGQEQSVAKLKEALMRGEAIAQIIGQGRDGDAAGFEMLKQQAAQAGIPAEAMAHLTVADLPRLREESGRTLGQLKTQLMQAQIGSERAQAGAANALAGQRRNLGGTAGARAPSGYRYVQDQSGEFALEAIPGGPQDAERIGPAEAKTLRERSVKLEQLGGSIKDYTTAIDGTSALGRVFTRGEEVSGLQGKHTDLLLQMKELYELGVLNGPDYELMLKMVEDPTSLMSIARGGEGLKAQISTVNSVLNRARNLLRARVKSGGVSDPNANAAAPEPATSNAPSWAQ